MRAIGNLSRRASAAVAGAIATFAPASALTQSAQWKSLPTVDDFAAAYPATALASGVEGRAVINCGVLADGSLEQCIAETEAPDGAGFGAAAISLAGKFRLADVPPTGRVRIPLRFASPSAPPMRAATFTPATGRFARYAPAGPYWPDRALRQGIGGFGVIDCVVAPNLLLHNCVRVAGSTPDVGFVDAMLKMAERGFMKAAALNEAQTAPPDNVWRLRVDFPAQRLAP